MADLFNSGDSIESDGSDIVAKKIVFGAMIQRQLKTLRKYTCERDGFAKIIKELAPLEYILKPTSKLQMGDRIVCKQFYVLVENAGKIKLRKTTFSGDHNTQTFSTSSFTFAEISYPFDHILNAIQKREAQIKIGGRD